MNPSTAWSPHAIGRRGRRRRLGRLALARRRAGRDPDGDHGAVAGLGLDAQLAAREPRALAHPGQAERADAGQRVEVLGRLEAVTVVGDGHHDAVTEPAHVDVDARGVRVALDVGQRLLEDPPQLAQDQRRERPDVVERAAHPGPGALAPAGGLGADRGRQRELGVVASAQPGQQLARLLGRRAGVRRQLAGVLHRARRVDLDPTRQRQRGEPDPVHGLGQRVVHVAREPLTLGLGGHRALLLGQRILGLGLAVEQAPRPRAGDGHDRVQRRQHDQRAEVDQRRVELRADVDRVRVADDQHHAEQRRARVAVDEPSEQRGPERVEEERAVDAGQYEDQHRQHELAREIGRVADERRPDLVPAQHRVQRRGGGDDDRRRDQLPMLLLAERQQRHDQDAHADVEDQPAGTGQPAARAVGAAAR